MFITAETVEEDRKHFTPESAPFVTEGSIIYHFVFQAWGSVELTDPDAYLQHAIREHLRDPLYQGLSFSALYALQPVGERGSRACIRGYSERRTG